MGSKQFLDPIRLVSVTTTQRDALSGVGAGDVVYNTTIGCHQTRIGSTWQSDVTLTADELLLPTPVWSAGTLAGGVIRQASGLQIAATYTQTAQPSDTAVGSPLVIDWNPTLNNTSAPYGPASATSFYGPRALANIQGLTQVGANQSTFAFTPIGFGDMHRVKNVVGANRSIVPGWVFMSARTTYADTNTVTLGGNDIAAGTAGFVDSQTFATANAGTLNGTTNSYEIISLLSMPFLVGSSHVSKRIGVKVNDMNQYLGTPGTDLSSSLASSGVVPNADSGVGTVDEQYGIWIPNLTQATRNVGISNASATVNPMLAVSVTAVGTTLPITATVLAVTATSAMTSTAAPLLAAGLDGQTIVIVNVGTNAWTLQDEASLANTGLLIAPTSLTVLLKRYDSITVQYSTAAGKWLLAGRSDPLSGSAAATDGTASHGKAVLGTTVLGSGFSVYGNTADSQPMSGLNSTGVRFGPGTGANDTTLVRTGTAAATFTAQLTMATGLTMTDAKDIAIGSTNGTKIGTATTQKIGLFNATPIVQPVSTVAPRDAMVNLGLLAAHDTLDVAQELNNRYLKIAGSYESFSRSTAGANTAALVSGTVTLAAFALPKNFLVTNISVLSLTTAAVTPTHWWFSLCDSSYITLRSTADQTTTAWAATTLMTKALSSTFTTTYEGLYYIAVMVTAATVPTLCGAALNATPVALAPLISLTGLTGQTTAPADATNLATSPGALNQHVWAYVT